MNNDNIERPPVNRTCFQLVNTVFHTCQMAFGNILHDLGACRYTVRLYRYRALMTEHLQTNYIHQPIWTDATGTTFVGCTLYVVWM
jgi:hypothetical protein